MAESYPILISLFRSIKQIVQLQISRLNELVVKDYPYNSSRKHIKLIRAFYENSLDIIKNLEEEFQKTKRKEDFEEIEIQLKQISQTLTWISGNAINIISSSTRENVSQNTVFLINHLTTPFKDKSEFILIPTNDHNYEITHWGIVLDRLSSLLGVQTDKLPYAPKSFSILSFPAVYKDNLVAHSLMGHEIGHFIILHENLKEELSKHIKFDSDKFNEIALLETAKEELKNKGKLKDAEKDKIKNEIHERIFSNIMAGSEEILCDLIGFRTMGPVLLFATVEFLLADTPTYKIFQDYPPPALRLQTLIDEIKLGGFIKKLTGKLKVDFKELVTNIQDHISPENIGNYSQEELLQYGACKQIIPELCKIADDVITRHPELKYSAEMFGSDLPILIKKLKRLVPPCENEREIPANIISILNSGMIFRLLARKFYPDTYDDFESKIDPLVLRATHQSFIQKTLQEKIKEMEK